MAVVVIAKTAMEAVVAVFALAVEQHLTVKVEFVRNREMALSVQMVNTVQWLKI